MRLKKLAVFLVSILLVGCNLPSAPRATPTGNAVATQVSQLLTAQPSATKAPSTAAFQPSPFPSATPLPPTETPTLAPTPAQATPTTSSGDPKNGLGTPTWQDKLATGKYFYLYDTDNTKVSQEPGSLILSGKEANGWVGWSLTFSHPASNFYLEGQFDTQQCSGADQYGLVFRAPGEQGGYFYGVTCDGRFNLHARDMDAGSDNALIPSTSNGAILAGSNQINRLGVMANGDRIALYANGVLLKELDDTTFATNKGYYGAFVAANATTGFTVKMHEISLWKLP